MSQVVHKIFEQRGDFVIIGLTGRTGSGCSTVADLLSSKSLDELNPKIPFVNGGGISNADRKYKIAYNYLKQNWTAFYHIKVRDIITSFIIEYNFKEFTNFYNKTTFSQDTEKLYNILHSDYRNKLSVIKGHINKLSSVPYNYIRQSNPNWVGRYIINLARLTDLIKSDISNSNQSYASLYQELGDNIRKSGKAFDATQNYCTSAIAERINDVIKYWKRVKKHKNVFITIDAFRNPYEVFFFKERYASFYLMSVNTEDQDRLRRLIHNKLNSEQIKALDDREYPAKANLEKSHISQNIGRCIELADIHIKNEDCLLGYRHNLKDQIILYLSLIMHPGLFPPSHEERTMQVAYTAKFNSGCLSRQVGAVITDESYSIKALGWNSNPEGQVPCILRDCRDLINGVDQVAYSDFELKNIEFKNSLAIVQTNKVNPKISLLKGRHTPYCFKDVFYYETTDKNQVHTRSLHAEENAFLQISKHGGQGIKGGKLFTTASPCELCAKKAYQLGIKEIYYIDLYPGISREHVLGCGSARPEMKLFKGAIGRAYIHLYQPILSYKDEVYDILDIDIKREIDNKKN